MTIDVTPCGPWRRRFHQWRRAVDRALLLWWADGDTSRERLIWFDVVTQLWGPRHWMCACGNRERCRRRDWLSWERQRERMKARGLL